MYAPIEPGSCVCESCARRLGATVLMVPGRQAVCRLCFWKKPCEVVVELPVNDGDVFVSVVLFVGMLVLFPMLGYLIYDLIMFELSH
jgi:hypothetical protein